jgi:ribosome-associated toxin RatA of RatAB toxin-antitoxin module
MQNSKVPIALALLLIGNLGLLGSSFAASDWASLSQGQVVVTQQNDVIHDPVPSVQAKIWVNKSVPNAWKVISDPVKLTSTEPKVKKAQVVSRTARSQNVAFSVSMARLLPSFNYVVEQDLNPPNALTFHRLSGSFKDIQGSWLLNPAPNGKGSILTYNLKLDPGPLVPKGLLMNAVKSDLPNLMKNAKLAIEK